MGGERVSAGEFYRERVPAQFNRAHADDAPGGAGSVRTTIGIVVRDAAGEERFHLDIAGGRMTASDTPAQPPVLVLVHDVETLDTLVRESGDSVLGFLGALAGMEQDMLLTSQRVQNLHALTGALQFEVTGGSPFSLLAVFGGGEVPDEATCSIALDRDTYAELLSGQLTAQDAFMAGRVAVGGDMQLVMQLALAALSPE